MFDICTIRDLVRTFESRGENYKIEQSPRPRYDSSADKWGRINELDTDKKETNNEIVKSGIGDRMMKLNE